MARQYITFWLFCVGSGASGMTYVVKTGDTLTTIAAAHGTTVAAIQAANPSITNPNVILAGQSITLPGAGTTGRKLLRAL